jgi:hypothetical protein
VDKLIEIVNKSIADYGFRQIAQWSPEDVIAQWQLSSREGEALKGPVKDELDRMPVPVEPRDIPGEQRRLAEIVKKALE